MTGLWGGIGISNLVICTLQLLSKVTGSCLLLCILSTPIPYYSIYEVWPKMLSEERLIQLTSATVELTKVSILSKGIYRHKQNNKAQIQSVDSNIRKDGWTSGHICNCIKVQPRDYVERKVIHGVVLFSTSTSKLKYCQYNASQAVLMFTHLIQ